MDWLPAPVVSDRVAVRRLDPRDADGLVLLMTDAEVRRFVGGAQDLNTAHTKAATKIAQQNWGQFVIADRVTDQVLGSGDISRKRGPWEISFQLRQASWGQGLATEAVNLVIEWFFGHTDESVLIAVTQEANVRCSRLLERLGATMTGTFDQYGLTQRRYEFSRPGIHKPGK